MPAPQLQVPFAPHALVTLPILDALQFQLSLQVDAEPNVFCEVRPYTFERSLWL